MSEVYCFSCCTSASVIKAHLLMLWWCLVLKYIFYKSHMHTRLNWNFTLIETWLQPTLSAQFTIDQMNTCRRCVFARVTTKHMLYTNHYTFTYMYMYEATFCGNLDISLMYIAKSCHCMWCTCSSWLYNVYCCARSGAVTAPSCEGHSRHTINPTWIVRVYIVPSTFFLFFYSSQIKALFIALKFLQCSSLACDQWNY